MKPVSRSGFVRFTVLTVLPPKGEMCFGQPEMSQKHSGKADLHRTPVRWTTSEPDFSSEPTVAADAP